MRLIDADKFNERVLIAGGFVEEELTEDFKDGVLTVLEMLKTEPSADVTEVIRCKNCKHYEIGHYTDDKRYKPSVCVVGRYAIHRSDDWFCADAERRTDG